MKNLADIVHLDFCKQPLGKVFVKIWVHRRIGELTENSLEGKQIALKGEVLDQRRLCTPVIFWWCHKNWVCQWNLSLTFFWNFFRGFNMATVELCSILIINVSILFTGSSVTLLWVACSDSLSSLPSPSITWEFLGRISWGKWAYEG